MNNRWFDDPKYKAWRAKVRKRDKHQCRWPGCGSRKKLQTHHIQRWADNELLRYNVGNGITLCRMHHDRIKDNEAHYVRLFLQILINDQKKN